MSKRPFSGLANTEKGTNHARCRRAHTFFASRLRTRTWETIRCDGCTGNRTREDAHGCQEHVLRPVSPHARRHGDILPRAIRIRWNPSSRALPRLPWYRRGNTSRLHLLVEVNEGFHRRMYSCKRNGSPRERTPPSRECIVSCQLTEKEKDAILCSDFSKIAILGGVLRTFHISIFCCDILLVEKSCNLARTYIKHPISERKINVPEDCESRFAQMYFLACGIAWKKCGTVASRP